ncbi:MAG TPA: hypothetical protein VD928_03125 [Candidatus Paceibacterota bacterium]|nr:hypothetical protein [Candidatus Paceibacterota bacterium]
MTVQSISRTLELRSLAAASREYLEKANEELPLPDGDEGMAIFARIENDFFYLPEARFPTNKSGHFAKTAPDGLYKAGGGCFIKSKYGTLVVSDERGGGLGVEWYKYWPVGLAKHSDGEDLMKGVRREFDEEVLIYSLDHKPRRQFVPKGAMKKTECEALGFKIDEAVEFGEMIPYRFFINEVEKAYELHAQWDISGLNVPYSAHYDEDMWFRGGRPGIPVVALNSQGLLTGFFSGQQGFIRPPPVANLHPSVADFLGRPAPIKKAA